MAAMSHVTLLLATLVLLASGAKIMVNEIKLPEVVDGEKIIPPQGIPKGAPNDIIVPDAIGNKLDPVEEGPLMLQDMDDIRERNRLCRLWMETYDYATEKLDMEGLTAEEIEAASTKEIAAVQEFYGIEVTGKFNEETLIIMSQPRCAKKDTDDVESGSRKKRWNRLGSTVWKDFPLTISFKNYERNLAQSEQEAIARHCATLWASESGVSFSMAPRGVTGNIDIRFEYIDGPWNTVGQGLSPKPWGDFSSYLKLDSNEKWKARGTDSGYGVSLTWALCHEMGHNLGLGHSNDRSAIMYPSGMGQDENKLSYDDRTGITSLYGGPNGRTFSGSAPSPTYRPAPTTRRPAPTTRRPAPTYRRPAPTYRRPAPTTRTTYRTSRPTTYYRTAPIDHSRRYPPAGHVPRYRPTYSSRPVNYNTWFRKRK